MFGYAESKHVLIYGFIHDGSFELGVDPKLMLRHICIVLHIFSI
jgi:hypothetical protein